MLTFADVPKTLLDIYDESKILAREIFDQISDKGERLLLEGGKNLLHETENSVIFFTDAIMKYIQNKKLVRFYSNDDLFYNPGKKYFYSCELICDFAVECIVFSYSNFLKLVSENPDLNDKWVNYQRLDSIIMTFLCSIFLTEEVKPKVNIKKFAPGEVILEEGASPNEIHEMLTGRASVEVKGINVGDIKESEIFGEISFFTGLPRTASVLASTNCVVNMINESDFNSLMRYRPELVIQIARTLAKRIVSLNEKLVEFNEKNGNT